MRCAICSTRASAADPCLAKHLVVVGVPPVTVTETPASSVPGARFDNAEIVLDVAGLQTYLFTRLGVVKAVDDVTFSVRAGETLAIVGESGCGKTMTSLSLMRLVPNPPGRIVGGSIKLAGRELTTLNEAAMRDVRGNEISMIFQEPMTSLNPVMTIGKQIAETLRLHQDLSKAAAFRKAVDMLRLVKIPEPAQRAKE
ncbi:MAG: ABC transporter ATP-binding protein, partial [Alphaproteobacteria bacterium]|nr:ABC transporter ATP-binding protein [Alphaproteobacteria bacterium]